MFIQTYPTILFPKICKPCPNKARFIEFRETSKFGTGWLDAAARPRPTVAAAAPLAII
jgi:hypothetical protein